MDAVEDNSSEEEHEESVLESSDSDEYTLEKVLEMKQNKNLLYEI